jgi:single-strand DNA-binding protein
MTDINHVVLVGRLTRDSETKYTAAGQAVCKFSIAVNRKRKVGDAWEDEANYFDIVLWGRQAEAINKYLVKGKQIGVDGELRLDRWEQDGQKRSKVEIVANNIQLLGGGAVGGSTGDGAQGGYYGAQSAPSGGGRQEYGGSPSYARPPAPQDDSYGHDEKLGDSFSDDIPF